MRRLFVSASAAALVCGLFASPSASAQQSLNMYLGGFVPHSLDARDSNDVLLANNDFLSTFNQANGIDMGQFHGFTFGGEYLVGLGRYFEAGLGLGFYQRTALTSYTDFVNEDGSEIAQDLKLRIVPFTATFKLLPFGTNHSVQPYVGAGVGAFYYRYSEEGQFIDFSTPTLDTFSERFVGSGTAAGPVVVGGVRAVTHFGVIGGELRYQHAVGDLPIDQGFSGGDGINPPKIDLGGWNYLFTIGFRF